MATFPGMALAGLPRIFFRITDVHFADVTAVLNLNELVILLPPKVDYIIDLYMDYMNIFIKKISKSNNFLNRNNMSRNIFFISHLL
jgi:hypothetical protein